MPTVERTEIRINCDDRIRKNLQKALEDNEGYCPCRLVKTEDTKCMCKEFRDQKQGWCHCGLYEKIVYLEN